MVLTRIHEGLCQGSFNDVISAVAEATGCDRLGVLVTDSAKATRRGARCKILRLRYQFNPEMNGAIRATGVGYFDRSKTKCWDVPVSGNALAQIERVMRDHFAVIIDADAMVVLRNVGVPAAMPRTAPSCALLPFHVALSHTALLEALARSRPRECVGLERLYIHSGGPDGFVPLPRDAAGVTQMPFALLRYSVDEGRPRYAAVSTLGPSVEEVSFGNGGARTLRLIARFADTCRAYGVPAFIWNPGPQQIITEKPGMRCALQGGFDRFEPVLLRFAGNFQDLPILPIASDLVSLSESQMGDDCPSSGVSAYVPAEPWAISHLEAVGSFFGGKGYPVVFSRTRLDDWGPPGNEWDAAVLTGQIEFEETLIQQAAHWLWALDPGRGDSGPRGPLWAVYADLLRELTDPTMIGLLCVAHCPHGAPYPSVRPEADRLRSLKGDYGAFWVAGLRRAAAACMLAGPEGSQLGAWVC